MKINHDDFLKNLGKLTKTLILWSMFISGIFLATRQAKATGQLLSTSFVIQESPSHVQLQNK